MEHQRLKYAVIIIDGAADVPLAELGGRTPLEAAAIPTFDWLAAHGILGLVNHTPQGLPCGSDVAIMSLLGYDPQVHYSGRAPIEAVAQDLRLRLGEWVFRCNLVTLRDRVMLDHSADNIANETARQLIQAMNRATAGRPVRFYPGVSYRNLMTCTAPADVACTPPHDILGQPIDKHLPRGRDAAFFIDLMELSQKVISDCGHAQSPANSIWLWGQGQQPKLPLFKDRFGLSGAVITAVDLVRGLAKLIGWDNIPVAGATGYFDTDYRGKGRAAIAALDSHDLVCVHVEATDEAGHKGDAAEKIRALEQIDALIAAPLLAALRGRGHDFRLLVLPDHPTPCTIRTHVHEPVPFALYGTGGGLDLGGQPPGERSYTEAAARQTGLLLEQGHTLMERFVRLTP